MVTATVEVTVSKEVHIDIAARAQRHTNEILVLDKYCRHTHLLDSQGVINKALAIALLEPEAAHLLLRERHMRYGTLAQQLHLAVDGVAKQAGTTLSEGVIYIIIYLLKTNVNIIKS